MYNFVNSLWNSNNDGMIISSCFNYNNNSMMEIHNMLDADVLHVTKLNYFIQGNQNTIRFVCNA
jgi:hypothetical protein